MKTVDMSWVDCSDGLYNKISENNVNPLYYAIETAKSAIYTVSNSGDIGTLTISLTIDDIEELNEKRRNLVSFCNAIHYEVSQMVDNPFSIGISDLLESVYMLNPSDFQVKENTTTWHNMTLHDLLELTMVDVKLKIYYNKKFHSLNKDKPSKKLKDAIKEAKFWQSEFEKSEQCQAIARSVFTPEIREGWTAMSSKEKKTIIEKYISQISDTLFGKSSTKIKYNCDGYGFSFAGLWGIGRYIAIDSKFINQSTENFSVDKVIDTLTHETRHQYQNMVKRNPKDYGISKSLKSAWKKRYINSDKYYKYYRQEIERDARAFAALSRPEE